MFSSPMMLAALSLLAAPAPSSASTSGWQPDYGSALASAASKHRPVAVVIGSGAAQSVPAEVASALKSSFECLYIDATTPAGSELATQFRMTQGLVISDADGKVQALRHDGALSAADAATYAGRFAQATGVTRTEYASQMMGRPLMTQPAMSAPVYQPAPVMSAPVYQPAPAMFAPSYQAYPTVSGGCAGGSCGRVSYPTVTYSSGCANGRCGR